MLRSKVNKSINKLSLPDCNICKQMVDLFCRMVKYAVRQHSRLSQRQLGFLFIVLYGFYSAAFFTVPGCLQLLEILEISFNLYGPLVLLEIV